MATIKLYLDTRANAAGTPAPVKIALNMHGDTVMQSTGIKIMPDQWDKKSCKVVKHPQKQILNTMLASRLNEWEMALLKLMETGEARNARSASELKRKIIETITPKDTEEVAGDFFIHYIKYASSRRTSGTREAYRQTLRRMEAFDKDIRTRTFEDINKRWLTDFEAFMSQTAHSANARAFHFRNIRAVFNDALDEEITTAYPFRKFKIRREPTAKRSLSVEQLRTLATFPCEEYQKQYRDIFMLMFYLIGVNAVDLFKAKRDAVSDGRFEYIRSKTYKPYSIKIEPEAKVLLEKYKGKEHLISVMDTRNDYKAYLHRMNDALKRIGDVSVCNSKGKKVYKPLFPKISQYWCRHSWATIAAKLEIPKETIAAALGHGGNTVTDIYIDFDRRKVDEANRRVIDWVLYGKK